MPETSKPRRAHAAVHVGGGTPSLAAIFMVLVGVVVASCGARTEHSSDASLGDAANGADAATPQALVVEACAAYVSCGLWYSPDPGGPMSQCVTEGVADQACILGSGTSCDSVKTCLNGGDSNWTCALDASTTSGCDGSTSWWCNPPGVRSVTDCSRTGEMCDPSLGACTFGRCDPSVRFSCTGDSLRDCEPTGTDGGYSTPWYNCSADAGVSCEPDAAHTGECVGSGAPCTEDSCNGTKLVQCLNGRSADPFECGTLGLRCLSVHQTDAGSYGSVYCGLGAECDETFNDSCEGTRLTYCNLGAFATIDCAKAGSGACVPASQSPSTGVTGARCSQ